MYSLKYIKVDYLRGRVNTCAQVSPAAQLGQRCSLKATNSWPPLQTGTGSRTAVTEIRARSVFVGAPERARMIRPTLSGPGPQAPEGGGGWRARTCADTLLRLPLQVQEGSFTFTFRRCCLLPYGFREHLHLGFQKNRLSEYKHHESQNNQSIKGSAFRKNKQAAAGLCRSRRRPEGTVQLLRRDTDQHLTLPWRFVILSVLVFADALFHPVFALPFGEDGTEKRAPWGGSGRTGGGSRDRGPSLLKQLACGGRGQTSD
ncbi:hypothetical protein CB1_000880061 [Camelus ferus]|nr:hypothetical protein CB1_000880061 [Camelus ferus]